MFYFLLYLSLQIVLLAAWVLGALDPYQKKLQEFLLDCMGETKVSYGLKRTFNAERSLTVPLRGPT